MSASNRQKQVYKLLLLVLVIVFLMVILFWTFTAGDVVAGSFRLDDIQICEELDDNMVPISAGTTLPGGARQACLWFEYSKARAGDALEIVWKFGERRIQKDSFRLSQSGGVRAFYLLKEDGTPLPSGSYSVGIFCNGRERGGENFSVTLVSGDIEFGEEEFD